MRQELDSGFRRLALGNIGKTADVVGRLTGLAAHGDNGQPLEVELAGLAAIPEFSGPGPLFGKRRPHFRVNLAGRQVCRENLRVLAQHFFRGIAGQATEGFVGLDDMRVGIGDDDAFSAMGEGLGHECKLLFRLLAPGDDGTGAAVAGKAAGGIGMR